MLAQRDKYAELRNRDALPGEAVCACPGPPPLKLMYALGNNPLACLHCNREVPPERLAPEPGVVDEIVYWRDMYAALYLLWLDSGEYEDWAKAQLSDIHGRANTLGRTLQAQLDGARRCYYWYFQDQSADDYTPPRDCPSCGWVLEEYSGGIFPQLLCEHCSIVVSGTAGELIHEEESEL